MSKHIGIYHIYLHFDRLLTGQRGSHPSSLPGLTFNNSEDFPRRSPSCLPVFNMDTKDVEAYQAAKTVSDGASITQVSDAHVGRDALADVVPPHDSYEGKHRFDPTATWTEAEERRVVRKCDTYLLSWLCVMFFALQLDRGNLGNATADNLLDDLGLTTDDYNNGSTIQLLGFLSAEFPVQVLTKRYGFKYILPTMMMCWGTVSWGQSWMTNRTGFYITRALIGICEGGFIPGTVLFATYFYKSKELAIRLAAFWSTLSEST